MLLLEEKNSGAFSLFPSSRSIDVEHKFCFVALLLLLVCCIYFENSSWSVFSRIFLPPRTRTRFSKTTKISPFWPVLWSVTISITHVSLLTLSPSYGTDQFF